MFRVHIPIQILAFDPTSHYSGAMCMNSMAMKQLKRPCLVARERESGLDPNS